MLKKCFLGFIFLLVLSHSVQAQVYKCENEAGEINFSDEPCAKGETGERLKWLKGAASNKKSKKNKRAMNRVPAQADKTAKKAKKNNKAYVLLSLLTTTQLELETASLRSSLQGEKTDVPELMLSDGITIDLLKVDKIIINHKYGKNKMQARFIMADGYEEVKILKKPFPVISGEAKIGRFSKSLQDIKQIEFFNSKILLRTTAKKSLKNKSSARKKVPSDKKVLSEKNESPVIELDLSHQISSRAPDNVVKKPKIKVVGKHSANKSQTSGIQVDFVNEKKMTLQRKALSSSKGRQKSRAQHFLVSDKEQIPYDAIKTVKVRPTANNQLLVAVELKTREIRMEVMSPPFTRIIGKSDSGVFDHSLLDIKSISFQR